MTHATYHGLRIQGTVTREGYGGWNSLQPPTCSVEIDELATDTPATAWEEVIEPALLHYTDDAPLLDMLRAAFLAHTKRLRILPEWADELIRERCEDDLREALVKAYYDEESFDD